MSYNIFSAVTCLGSSVLISRSAFLVTMLSSMFCVTRVSPRSKKITLAGRDIGLPGGRFMELGLLRAPRNVVCDSQEVSWKSTLASREKKFLPSFFEEGSRQLKLI